MIDAKSIFLLTSSICMIVLVVYVIRLIISITVLSNNANVIALSVQKEIEPTLKELKEAAKSINSIAGSADSQIQNTKANIASLVGATACIGGKLKSFTQGIIKGISFGIGMFRK